MRFHPGFSGAVRRMGPLLSLAALLGACQSDDDRALDVAVIGAPSALLDQGGRLGPAAQLVQAATAQGLVTLDAQGQVVPALADRWIVTDDGDSYIFRLRDGTWPGGAPLNSQNVARALRQALAGLQGTTLGLDLADIAEVRVMTDRVLELRLARPVPELLQLLAQPELALRLRQQGSGPFEIVRGRPGQGSDSKRGEGATRGDSSGRPSGTGVLRLVEIPPRRLGLPPLSDEDTPSRAVRLHALTARAATEAFTRGDVAVVLGGRFADLPLGQAAAGLSRRALQIDPAAGLFGLAVVSDTGPLAASEFREALSMAIDRDALAGAIGLAGWTAAARIVPAPAATVGALAGAAGAASTGGAPPPAAAPPVWTGWPLEARRAEASARVARARTRNGGALPALRLAWPDGPAADAVFSRLAADFATIGVTLTRVAEGAPAELRLLDLVARYPGALWYLNQLSCAARRTICSATLDARLAQARAERDPDRRAAMLAAVEAQASGAALFLPLGAPIRWSLARPGQSGFAVNAAAFHPLPALVQPVN